MPAEVPEGAGNPAARARVAVGGIVQGVGFRPFVRNLATELGLAGSVRNDTTGALIDIEGEPAAITAFLARLRRDPPPLCLIEEVRTAPARPTGQHGFVIATSDPGGEHRALVPPDTATCADCLAELFDPADRRYLYPFINCTNCGPRFTIVRDVPSTGPPPPWPASPCPRTARTSTRAPDNRRYHAQPTCCPACGPCST